MIKVLPPKIAASYCEINQQLRVLFAWAVQVNDDTYQLQHSYIRCRDFLPDFLWMIHNKMNCMPVDGIYGFNYMHHHTKSPFMAIKINNGSVENLENNMNKHIPTTAVEFVGIDGDGVAIVKWSEAAMDSPWKISFFTFMLKLCCVKDASSMTALLENAHDYSPENTYVMSVTEPTIYKILAHWDKLEDPDLKIGNKKLQEMDINYIHNNTGFVSMFKKSSKSKLKQALESFS